MAASSSPSTAAASKASPRSSSKSGSSRSGRRVRYTFAGDADRVERNVPVMSFSRLDYASLFGLWIVNGGSSWPRLPRRGAQAGAAGERRDARLRHRAGGSPCCSRSATSTAFTSARSTRWPRRSRRRRWSSSRSLFPTGRSRGVGPGCSGRSLSSRRPTPRPTSGSTSAHPALGTVSSTGASSTWRRAPWRAAFCSAASTGARRRTTARDCRWLRWGLSPHSARPPRFSSPR